jgi:hypothetical protein
MVLFCRGTQERRKPHYHRNQIGTESLELERESLELGWKGRILSILAIAEEVWVGICLVGQREAHENLLLQVGFGT